MDTFPAALKPDHITEVEQSFNTTIVKFEGRAEQRFANQHAEDQLYRLSWNWLTESQLASLKSFQKNQLGAYKAWAVDDSRLDSTPVTVRFLTDSIRYRLKKGGMFADVETEIMVL